MLFIWESMYGSQQCKIPRPPHCTEQQIQIGMFKKHANKQCSPYHQYYTNNEQFKSTLKNRKWNPNKKHSVFKKSHLSSAHQQDRRTKTLPSSPKPHFFSHCDSTPTAQSKRPQGKNRINEAYQINPTSNLNREIRQNSRSSLLFDHRIITRKRRHRQQESAHTDLLSLRKTTDMRPSKYPSKVSDKQARNSVTPRTMPLRKEQQKQNQGRECNRGQIKENKQKQNKYSGRGKNEHSTCTKDTEIMGDSEKMKRINMLESIKMTCSSKISMMGENGDRSKELSEEDWIEGFHLIDDQIEEVNMLARYAQYMIENYQEISDWEELIFLVYKKYYLIRKDCLQALRVRRADYFLKLISRGKGKEQKLRTRKKLINFLKHHKQVQELIYEVQRDNEQILSSLRDLYNLIIQKSGQWVNMMEGANFSKQILWLMVEETAALHDLYITSNPKEVAVRVKGLLKCASFIAKVENLRNWKALLELSEGAIGKRSFRKIEEQMKQFLQ